MNKLVIILSIILIIFSGVFFGFAIYNSEQKKENRVSDNNIEVIKIEDSEKIATIKTSVEEEKTTPNTLIIYKTYYTKCKHYIKEYQDIDASLVNLTKKEFEEKVRGKWDIDKFSLSEIELSNEKEEYCNEHYKLILENNVIVVYRINENGIETEYEQTGITTEYLTQEDILKLQAGIYVYGKESLSSTIEDYE